jgi:alpha-L-fucosidase
VSKGGNFLLNIAPTADGDFEDGAYDRLKKIGKWMKVNSEAIYNTRPVQPYKEGKLRFTQSYKGTIYAVYLADENESTLPELLILKKFSPSPNAKIELLGSNTKIKWHKEGDGCKIEIPESIRNNSSGNYAWTLKIK